MALSLSVTRSHNLPFEFYSLPSFLPSLRHVTRLLFDLIVPRHRQPTFKNMHSLLEEGYNTLFWILYIYRFRIVLELIPRPHVFPLHDFDNVIRGIGKEREGGHR